MLLATTRALLGDAGLRVLVPEQLPPNDGGIAYGQLAVASARLAAEETYVASGMPAGISVAPVHVVVGVREESYHERYRKPDKLNEEGEEIGWPAPYWYVDSGACFMLIQLAALDEGLGTGVYGVPPEAVPALKALVGMPDDVHFTCVVTIGKRPPEIDESPLVSRLSQARLPLDAIVSWGRFTS